MNKPTVVARSARGLRSRAVSHLREVMFRRDVTSAPIGEVAYTS